MSKSAIKKAIKQVDSNGDGQIDFEEFMKLMSIANEIDSSPKEATR